MATIKKQKISVGEDAQTSEPCMVLVAVKNGATAVESSMAVPQRIGKMGLTYNQAILLLGICPKELKSGSQRDICLPTFVTALFTVAKMWIQLKCPLIDEQTSTIWYIHTMEYCSALKRKDVHSDTCVNLEDMFSEIRWSPKGKHCVILLI